MSQENSRPAANPEAPRDGRNGRSAEPTPAAVTTRTAQTAHRLREHGLRVTGPRLTILQAIERDRRHPSVEMIYEVLRAESPSLSLSTVYATLESFLRHGLVRRISAPGGRLRIDGTVQDHDHAVCRHCGEVFDVDRRLVDRPERPPRLPHGMRFEKLYVEYEVVCAQCHGSE